MVNEKQIQKEENRIKELETKAVKNADWGEIIRTGLTIKEQDEYWELMDM